MEGENIMVLDPNQIPWYIWYLSGILTALGILIALKDTVSARITAQDNLGWLLLAAGILLLVGWFLVPFFPIIWDAIVSMWEKATTTMLIAFIVGAILIALGIWHRQSHP